jgi:hypothetical protein
VVVLGKTHTLPFIATNKSFFYLKLGEIMNEKRVFKGVWIPKEIWINKELTWMEKLFLVEIDSLDNEKGCFASNDYFSDFFNLTKGRCSQIINSLKDKKQIIIEYEYEGKQIKKRIIKVFNILKGGIKYIKGGYLENAKDNNININNILSKDNKEHSKNTLLWEKTSSITKIIIDSFYNNIKKIKPKVRKNTFYNEKELFKVQKLVNNYIKGFNKINYNKLRSFIKDKEIPFNMDEGFKSEREFSHAFHKAMKIYDIDYVPGDKSKLPPKTSDFLLNHFMNWSSYFLYHAFNNPKKLKVEVMKRKDKNPDITKVYINRFNLHDLSIENNNKLVLFVDKIVKEHTKITQYTISMNNKLYFRHEYEDHGYLLYVDNIDCFIEKHMDYLSSNEEINTKFTMNLNKLFVGGYWWERFTEWFHKTFEIDLYPGEKQLIEKCKLFFKI